MKHLFSTSLSTSLSSPAGTPRGVARCQPPREWRQKAGVGVENQLGNVLLTLDAPGDAPVGLADDALVVERRGHALVGGHDDVLVVRHDPEQRDGEALEAVLFVLLVAWPGL